MEQSVRHAHLRQVAQILLLQVAVVVQQLHHIGAERRQRLRQGAGLQLLQQNGGQRVQPVALLPRRLRQRAVLVMDAGGGVGAFKGVLLPLQQRIFQQGSFHKVRQIRRAQLQQVQCLQRPRRHARGGAQLQMKIGCLHGAPLFGGIFVSS